MKSIITDKDKRFKNSKEMKDVLETIGLDGILKDTNKIITIHNVDDKIVEAEVDPVDYINNLNSQSRHGNSGTRAGAKTHILDGLTYSETKHPRQDSQDSIQVPSQDSRVPIQVLNQVQSQDS